MKWSLNDMKAATELTKTGKLAEATALIQQLLSGHRELLHTTDEPSLWQAPKLSAGASRDISADKYASKDAVRTAKQPNGMFETESYSSALGQRCYKLYTPRSYKGDPLPLVIMLHGCTQSPDDFAAGTKMNSLADEQGFFVAYPAQPKSANSMGCWNWFKAADQQKDKGEPALIAGIARQIMADYAVDANMVYVAGLSAGGAMAAVLGKTYPELFAAIGVHSGLPSGSATDMISAIAAMKHGGKHSSSNTSLHPVPIIVFHGDKDRTVNPVNSDDVIAQFDPAKAFVHAATTSGKSAGTMHYSRSVVEAESGAPQLEQWLIHGAGHAWSGGSSKGTYTEPRGPDASREMIRFFFQHKLKTMSARR